MRGCLTVLASGVAFLAILAWFALPPLASTVVTAGLVASGLSGAGTAVDIGASPPYELLALRADSVGVRSSDVTWRGMSVARLEVSLAGVDLGARTAASVRGRLDIVSIPTSDGTLAVERVDLLGPSAAIRATLAIDPTTTARLALAAAAVVEKALGRAPTSVELLAPDRVVVGVGGQHATGRLFIDESGAIVADLAPLGRATVVEPASDLPFVLESVTITPSGGASLVGVLDPRALGLSR